MNPVSWKVEGREICEGFDHQDAAAVDIQDAAAQLKRASEHFVIKKIKVVDQSEVVQGISL